MKKISDIFSLAVLLFIASLGIYQWRESIVARREATELANRLERDLEQWLVAGDDKDFQAMSSLRDIANYISYGPDVGWNQIDNIFYVVLLIITFRDFQKTELYKSLKDGFVRIWTWRP